MHVEVTMEYMALLGSFKEYVFTSSSVWDSRFRVQSVYSSVLSTKTCTILNKLNSKL